RLKSGDRWFESITGYFFRKKYRVYNGETKLLVSSQTKIWKRGSNPHASLFIFAEFTSALMEDETL
ncbi:MAG: hypothetical protein IKG72_11905, partial [Bacillus sp. (in: Bacteria)]|nr:hypothetical protein [Bacillus sp. (in: firmicutes)]